MSRPSIVVLGAGPAGVGAAWRLARRGAFDVRVIERNATVGGNAGSFLIEGMRVDFGSHRLHPSCQPAILSDIRRMLGGELLTRPRHGRILLEGKWLHFPLKPFDLSKNLPMAFTLGVAADTLGFRRTRAREDSFASVLEANLGSTICREFYFPYATKIWGLPPAELAAEQARRRVAAGSVTKMLRKILSMTPGLRSETSGVFYYPKSGFGAISEAYAREVSAAGAVLELDSKLTRLERAGGRWRLTLEGTGGARMVDADLVLSTVPVTVLAQAMTPACPDDVLAAAGSLRYRAMLLIYLVLETGRFTEFDAHYFPGKDIAITRLSEPKNYSLQGPRDSTVLCAELPCARNDALWNMTSDGLGKLVLRSLAAAGLEVSAPVRVAEVRRLPYAYPIYARDYRPSFSILDRWLGEQPALVSFGRQGLFAHDNTHHALAMAYAASDCVSSSGEFDRARWAAHRKEFEGHVVED